MEKYIFFLFISHTNNVNIINIFYKYILYDARIILIKYFNSTIHSFFHATILTAIASGFGLDLS